MNSSGAIETVTAEGEGASKMAKKRRKRTGRTAKAAPRKPSPAMEALTAYLKEHPKAPYAEVAEAISKDGHKVYPIMYGRAQALLGIVPMKKRGWRGGGRRAGRGGLWVLPGPAGPP